MDFPHMAFHPFAICAFIAFGVFAYVTIRTKPDLPTFIGAINSVGASPTALTVLFIGCVMLVMCKTYSLDSTVAGTIVGCGINMLTNQFTKGHTDSSGKTSSDTTNVPPTTTVSSSTATNQVGTSNEPPSPPTISSTP